MRAVYLIRHGEPAFTGNEPVCLGRLDLPLSDRGMAQAERLGNYFQSLPGLPVFTSPLLRCRQTASAIGGEAEACDGLIEVDMGQWTGLDFAEIRRRWPETYDLRGKAPAEIPPPGGESLIQCGDRALAAVQTLLAARPGEDLVIVAHSGVNRMLYAAMMGLEAAAGLSVRQSYGGITQLLLDGERILTGMIDVRPEELPPPVPDETMCRKLFRQYGTPESVIEHGFAVARVAIELCRKLENQGVYLNKELVFAGATLHDLAKTESRHARTGAVWLTARGYASVGAVVGSHMKLEKEDEARWSEKAVVFLADKLVRETSRVTLEDRFFSAPAPGKLPYIRERYRQAKALLSILETG